MLVSFTVGNWKSFREKGELSLQATAERRFRWSLPVLPAPAGRLLPVLALYGANASGKSNFFSAIEFLKTFVTRGVEPGEPIPVHPYRLASKKLNAPLDFSVVFSQDGRLFEYSISLDARKVLFEKLVEYRSRTRESVLFERKEGDAIVFGKKEDTPRNHFVFEGTQANLAFLTSAFRQKVTFVEPACRWFRDSLHLIGTHSYCRSGRIYTNGDPLQEALSRYLARYDTGIENITSKRVPLPEAIRPQKIKEGPQPPLGPGIRCSIKHDEDGYKASLLLAMHRDEEGRTVPFNFSSESEGTGRLVDLLPALILCNESPQKEQVIVIDEVDRSLHPNIVRQMVTEYLQGCSQDTRHQLIMTTHDTGLMDQSLLRRDEMWIVDKRGNSSKLYSISDFNMKGIRFDTVLDKLYRAGRFGGVPRTIIPQLPVTKKEEC